MPTQLDTDSPFVTDARTLCGLAIIVVVGAVASASGVGGGAIFIPLLNALVGFDLKSSTALSQACITCGAAASLAVNLLRSHPADPWVPLVDFPLAAVLTPILLMGVGAGVLLNVMLPSWLLTVLLLMLLTLIITQSVHKGRALWLQENLHRQQHHHERAHSGSHSAGKVGKRRATAADNRDDVRVPLLSAGDGTNDLDDPSWDGPSPPPGPPSPAPSPLLVSGFCCPAVPTGPQPSTQPSIAEPPSTNAAQCQQGSGHLWGGAGQGTEQHAPGSATPSHPFPTTTPTTPTPTGTHISITVDTPAPRPRSAPVVISRTSSVGRSLPDHGASGAGDDSGDEPAAALAASSSGVPPPRCTPPRPSAALTATLHPSALLPTDLTVALAAMAGGGSRGRSASVAASSSQHPYSWMAAATSLFSTATAGSSWQAFNELGAVDLDEERSAESAESRGEEEWIGEGSRALPQAGAGAGLSIPSGRQLAPAPCPLWHDNTGGPGPQEKDATAAERQPRPSDTGCGRGLSSEPSGTGGPRSRSFPEGQRPQAPTGPAAAMAPPSAHALALVAPCDHTGNSFGSAFAATVASPSGHSGNQTSEADHQVTAVVDGPGPVSPEPSTPTKPSQQQPQQEQPSQAKGQDPSLSVLVRTPERLEVVPKATHQPSAASCRWAAQGDQGSSGSPAFPCLGADWGSSGNGEEDEEGRGPGQPGQTAWGQRGTNGAKGGMAGGGSDGGYPAQQGQASDEGYERGPVARRSLYGAKIPSARAPAAVRAVGPPSAATTLKCRVRVPWGAVSALVLAWGVYFGVQVLRNTEPSCSVTWWAVVAAQEGLMAALSIVGCFMTAAAAAAPALPAAADETLADGPSSPQTDSAKTLAPAALAAEPNERLLAPSGLVASVEETSAVTVTGGTAGGAGPLLSGVEEGPYQCCHEAPPSSVHRAKGPAGEPGRGGQERSGRAVGGVGGPGADSTDASTLQAASPVLVAPVAVLVATCGAGLAGGLLGLGGGMVMGPLLLHLGVQPQVTAATSGAMVLFSSSAALVQFVMIGRINLQYAAVFGTASAAASVVGSQLLGRAVKASGRPSLVVLSLSGVMAAGGACVAVFGLVGALEEMRGGGGDAGGEGKPGGLAALCE